MCGRQDRKKEPRYNSLHVFASMEKKQPLFFRINLHNLTAHYFPFFYTTRALCAFFRNISSANFTIICYFAAWKMCAVYVA